MPDKSHGAFKIEDCRVNSPIRNQAGNSTPTRHLNLDDVKEDAIQIEILRTLAAISNQLSTINKTLIDSRAYMTYRR